MEASSPIFKSLKAPSPASSSYSESALPSYSFVWRLLFVPRCLRLDSTSHNSDSGECCPPIGLPKIFTLGPKIAAAYFTLDSCSLVYVRVCKVDTNYITQREVLCTDICLDSCSAPICFAWVPMVSPETTAVIRPYTCEELKCQQITRALDELEHLVPVLLAHRVAQNGAQQPDVGPHRLRRLTTHRGALYGANWFQRAIGSLNHGTQYRCGCQRPPVD